VQICAHQLFRPFKPSVISILPNLADAFKWQKVNGCSPVTSVMQYLSLNLFWYISINKINYVVIEGQWSVKTTDRHKAASC